MIPKVNISGCKLSENYYRRDNTTWDIPTLIAHCKEKDYQVFDLPLAAIPLGYTPLVVKDFKSFIQHCKRVQEANLEYPIILDDEGSVADGYHRIAKAIMNGDTTIKAIRMEEMPAASNEIENK